MRLTLHLTDHSDLEIENVWHIDDLDGFWCVKYEDGGKNREVQFPKSSTTLFLVKNDRQKSELATVQEWLQRNPNVRLGPPAYVYTFTARLAGQHMTEVFSNKTAALKQARAYARIRDMKEQEEFAGQIVFQLGNDYIVVREEHLRTE